MNATANCRHLRNKKMYIPALVAQGGEEAGETPDRSCHCWCNCTLTEVGPDDRPVGPRICTSERSCFEG